MIQLNSQSDSVRSGIDARYYIAQHMPDILRKEKRNIGVLVQKGEFLAARFVGEKEPGGLIDKRSLRSFPDPKLYCMWVRHWRKEMQRKDWEKALFENQKVTYQFIPGGDVTDTGTDTVDQVANYLFSILVSGGGLKEAIGEPPDSEEVAEIKADFHSELRRLKLLPSVAPQTVRNPVYEERDVKGKSNWHRMSFVQDSPAELWAYEPLNLTTSAKRHMRERAGYLAYVFTDLTLANSPTGQTVNASVILRVNDDDRTDTDVKYALQAVEDHAEIIDWSSQQQRRAVLNRCEMLSTAT